MHNHEGGSRKHPKGLYGRSEGRDNVGIVYERQYHEVCRVRLGIGGLIALRQYGCGSAMIPVYMTTDMQWVRREECRTGK